MTIEWNKVTWYSKAAAVVVFLATFALAFYLGNEYGKQNAVVNSPVDVPAHNTGDNATVGDLTLGVGQRGTVGGVSVTLNAVQNDYRCPIDVQCIQAGAINSNVTFLAGGKTETKNMPSDEVPQQFGGYKISITDTLPPARSGVRIPQSNYKVTFHIEKI